MGENSINLQAMFCGIFGVEFGQNSFRPPEEIMQNFVSTSRKTWLDLTGSKPS
jgi:hypothetical protein